ncbi:MAG: LLM class flavin-dependent oxidoreductase [Chloroflexi bacterium]|nr:LLM class flavin-dependent oxidoreductase [Chloroflexota bacterium]
MAGVSGTDYGHARRGPPPVRLRLDRRPRCAEDDEYRAYNWPFPSPAARIRQLDETVEICRRLWTADDVTYAGRHYAVTNAYLQPKPDPLPSIMIGGGGEQLTLKVVARHADWWNLPGGSLENYARKLAILDGYCAEIGRDATEIVRTWSCEVVAVAATEAEARRLAEASPFYRGAGLIGTPAQVIDQIEAWKAIGVRHFQLRFADCPRLDGIERFIQDVLPHVR